MKDYKEINGISFSVETPNDVCNILSNYCGNGQTVRVFYGDKETGRDWCCAYDTIGYIGKSRRRYKVPLLIKTKRSRYGCAILDDYVVKITVDKKVVYQHQKYHCPIEICEGGTYGYQIKSTEGNDVFFQTDTYEKAKKEFEFFMGYRNSH